MAKGQSTFAEVNLSPYGMLELHKKQALDFFPCMRVWKPRKHALYQRSGDPDPDPDHRRPLSPRPPLMATPAGPNRPRRFDPSMSRRTRRPVKVSQDWDKSDGPEQRMSLQELLLGGAAGWDRATEDADEGSGVTAKISVSHEEEEEEEKKTMILPAAVITSGAKHGELLPEKKKDNNKLAIVAKPGGASSGMVSRYVKVVLNNFIQARSAAKKKRNELKLL